MKKPYDYNIFTLSRFFHLQNTLFDLDEDIAVLLWNISALILEPFLTIYISLDPLLLFRIKIFWCLSCRWVSSGVVGSPAFAAYDQGMQIGTSHVNANIIFLVMGQSKIQSQDGEILLQSLKVAW